MRNEILLIISVIVFGFILFLLLIKKWLNNLTQKLQPSGELLEWLKSTNLRLDTQNKNIISTLQASTRDFNSRLDNAAKYISDVQKNIGEMSEIGRGMKELQEFLQSPKMRGNIGELILKELLSQLLPKQAFFMQYAFKSGAIVDAAIKTGSGIIPIDSKFPMENFRKMLNAKSEEQGKSAKNDFIRDVKKHIDDIAKKYILTEEGTIDYALMYLPSEAVYYELANNADIFDYAVNKRVLPVSPVTLYAYLRAILTSFEGQKIEKQAKQILQLLRGIQKDYLKTEDNLTVLNKHLTNAVGQMNNVVANFTVMGQKLNMTHSLEEAEENKIPVLSA